MVLMVLLVKIPNTVGNEQNLCPISEDIHEIRRHFKSIKDTLHSKDKITDVILLKANKLNNIQSSEKCCFLLELGRFYVENVFSNVTFDQLEERRGLHHLANSFLGLKIELKHCHSTMRCNCGKESHQVMKDFKDDYYKLDTKAAALKAVGDLNILFHWMEKK
ncbi:interleukin-20-like [Pelobates fuscus]|uniref:interleukin-20-like n=1 Tax=Pelobates fuscus TaxID=191477 RepID=UPI002FE48E89